MSGSPAFYRGEVEDYLDKIGKLRVARTGINWLFPAGNGEAVSDKVTTT